MPIVGIASGRGDLARDVRGDRLEHDRVRAGLLERARVGEQPLAAARIAALDLEAAELVVALRREADVAHHRDARGDEPVHELGVDRAALELDRVAAALLHQLAGVGHALLDRRLVRHERHVADDVRAARPAGDGAAVVDDLVERDRQGRVVALHDHAERVADEQHVGAGLVEQARERGVVGGEHGDPLASLLHLPQGVDGDATRGRLHSVRPFDCR